MTKASIILSLMVLVSGFTQNLRAQQAVSDFPFQENFELPFSSAPNFLPHWKGNVEPGVMGQYTEYGNSSLFMIPEGEETPTNALLYLDLSGRDFTYMRFKVATRKNGATDDRKRSKLSVAVSTDGGRTFAFGKKIGPEMGFENVYSGFEEFEYPFPPVANGRSNVVIRFQGKAGGGPHLSSKLLIDDIYVGQARSDIFAPFIVGEVSPSGLKSIQINFSEPLDPVRSENFRNYTFGLATDISHLAFVESTGNLPKVSSATLINDGYSLLLKLSIGMEQGEYYSFWLRNITDLAGNTTNFVIDELVYNVLAPGDLVISEVFFHDPGPATPMQKLQFVEIFNPTNKPVPLGGLRIKGAISAHNMPNVKLSPGGFWIITRNAASFEQTFGFEAWEWKGSWIQYDESHEGETIESQELYIQTTVHHGADYVDYVSFDFGDPEWAALNESGYSMELCNLSADNSRASNWYLADDQAEPYDYYYGNNRTPYKIYATPQMPRAGEKSCGPNGDKVIVCHKAWNGNKDLCINPNDVFYHILHGDWVGSCEGGCDEEVGFRGEVEEEVLPVTETYLEVSPNPIRDFATIRVSPDLGVIRQVEVFALSGKQLRRVEHIDHAVFSFYTTGLPAGVYLLKIRTELGIYTKRMVVQ